jgi:DNA-binding NtrC family response regulator
MTPADNNENARASAAPLAAAAAAYAGNATGPAPFVPKRLADAERDVLVQTLGYTQGNREIAADILGISVTLLREKLAALGLA